MFAEVIRAHRLRLGLTQEATAERAGLSVRNLRDIERGRIRAPRPSTVHRLADVFELAGAEREEFHTAARAAEPEPGPQTAPDIAAEPTAGPIDEELDRAARHLAAAVRRQWTAEARTRSLHRPEPIHLTWSNTERPVAARASAILGTGGPLPTRPDPLRLHGDLTDLVPQFRQLPSRQLVVLGEPGAGKTVLAILLTLGLIAEADEPIPVLLPLASWNPHREDLLRWLTNKLVESYPGLANTAAYGADAATRLMESTRILPVLDGLDETPPALHAAAIEELDRAVSGGRPLVVTCRSTEYEAAVRDSGSLLTRAAVVEIEPVGVEAAIAALVARNAANDLRWQPIAEELREHPDGTLAHALRTPLMVDLARTAFAAPKTAPAELLDKVRFPDATAIEYHLLDAYLPATYGQRPDPSGFEPDDAENWLGFLARELDRQQSRDIAWWRLDRAGPRYVAGLYLGLLTAPFFALAGWLADGPINALIYFIDFAIAGSLAHTFGRRPGPLQVEWRFHRTLGRFLRRFAIGAVIGGALGLGWDLPAPITAVLAVVFGGACGLHVWLNTPVDADRVSSPAATLRHDRTATWAYIASFAVSLGLFYAIAFALAHDAGPGKALSQNFDLVPAAAAGIAAALLGRFLLGSPGALAYGVAATVIGGLVYPHASTLWRAAGAGAAFGLAVGLTVGLARAWGAFVVARQWHALRGHLPPHLLRFLADAHRRGVLRQVGAVYQFRHARLQDRLAARRPPSA